MNTLLKKFQLTNFTDLPYSFLAFLARFSVAGVFWKSGQTKINGFEFDIVNFHFSLSKMSISENAFLLFKEEYQLPVLPYELATYCATIAEHILPALLLIGLASRWSALGLLVMTLVIQIFVYPSAYLVHGLWSCSLLMIIYYGPGRFSFDHYLRKKFNLGFFDQLHT